MRTNAFETANVTPNKLVPDVSLRPALRHDYDFALGLYLEHAKPLLMKLGRWDEERVTSRFKSGHRLEAVHIICLDGGEIGWMQTSDTATGCHLHNLHILERYRNRGIGTKLIEALQDSARERTRPMTLNVIRGNPALTLYLRLGFHVVGEDEEKLQMRWEGRRS